MENASLSSVVWNNITAPSSESDDGSQYLANIRDRVLKIIYIAIGTLGVLDNLFVLMIFILFIKITEKVFGYLTRHLHRLVGFRWSESDTLAGFGVSLQTINSEVQLSFYACSNLVEVICQMYYKKAVCRRKAARCHCNFRFIRSVQRVFFGFFDTLEAVDMAILTC